MDFSCIDIRELLDSTLSKWFENPGDKSPNLDDLGIQLDCNDTTKDTSKDTKERFVEPSVIPQVYVNEYNEDIDPTWTNMENAKWASKKEADLVGETDQEGDVFMYNYRSDQEEPKDYFFTDEIYPSGIEPRFYTKAEEETSQTSVVNNVVDNVKDSVSEKVTPQVGGSSGTPRMYGTKPSGDKQMKNYAFELTTIEKLSAKDLRYINREFPEYSQRKLFNDLMEVDNELIALKNDPNVQSYLLANTKYQTNIIDSSAYGYLDKLTSLSKKVDDLIDNVKSHLPDEYLGEYDSTFSYGERVKSSIDEYYNKISDKIQSVVDNKNSSFELTTIDKLADLFGDGVRQDEIPDSENRFLNRSPITEVNKDQKEELIEKAKKVNKPVTYIPKDLNFPFIEDEMAGNKLFYTDTDFLLDDLYQ